MTTSALASSGRWTALAFTSTICSRVPRDEKAPGLQLGTSCPNQPRFTGHPQIQFCCHLNTKSLNYKHLTVNHYEDYFRASTQIEFAQFYLLYGRQLTFPKQTVGIELCHFPSAMSLIIHQQMESEMRRSCKIIYVFIENFSTSSIMLSCSES